jgi:hypothetical protein
MTATYSAKKGREGPNPLCGYFLFNRFTESKSNCFGDNEVQLGF